MSDARRGIGPSVSGFGALAAALRRLPERASALSGWRGALATVALGAAAAAALPPLHVLPGLFAFAALAWRLDGQRSPLAAAATGWLFAFGYHVAGLYWVSNALLVDSARYAWLVPLAAIGLPMALAAFPAAAFALLPRLSPPGPVRAVLAVVLWSVADYLRGHVVFSGLPWNLPAYALSGSDSMSQAAAWLGAYGLGVPVLLAAVAPALLAGPAIRGRRAAAAAGVLCLAMPLVLWAAGAVRLNGPGPGYERDRVIRIVQGNVPQKDKWNRDLKPRHLARYHRLSVRPRAGRRAAGLADGAAPTVVVWPETAVAGYLAGDRRLREAVAMAAPAGGSLVTGSLALTDGSPRRLYNSMLALRRDGSVAARYDKSHLVPFGEYVPLRRWLPLPRIVQSFSDFSPGPGLRTLAVAGLGAASPLICYEVIFPGAVIAPPPAPRPAALLNLTNDAWYGRSSGPYQHLAISRMRAIEEGLPLIRAANTGISGVYDALGRTVVEIPLGETGAADSYLPRPLTGGTVYARHGDLAFSALLAMLLAAAGPGWLRSRRGGGRDRAANRNGLDRPGKTRQ